MSFYMPLGLIGLIGVPILILIYLLKRRYHEETVPSTFLWKRSLAYMKKRMSWNMRNSLLLLLEIIAVVLVSLILARPYVTARKTGEVIAIIDASASMQSEDASGVTRFARAKEQIEQLAEKADANHRVTVIVAGDTAKAHIWRSDTRADIKKALAECQCTLGSSDLEGALRLAEQAQEENTRASIVLYTDTQYEVADGIEIVDVTNREWNIAALGLTGEQVGGVWRFQGQIASYGHDATVTASLYVDGEYVSIKKVDCSDGETVTVDFRDYRAVNYTVAQLIVSVENEQDSLSQDNTFSLYNVTQSNKLVEIVFGPDSRDQFLDSALRAVKGVTVTSVQITSALDENGCENRLNSYGVLEESSIKYTGYDLYVFVGIYPETMPEDGAVWFFDPPRLSSVDAGGDPVSEQISLPADVSATLGSAQTAPDDAVYRLSLQSVSEEPYAAVLQGLRLQEVAVKEYIPLLSDSYVSLITCEGDTVLAAGKEGHQRVMLLTVTLSDLTTNMTDYVVLIGNMFAYSCPELLENNTFTVGETASLLMPPGATELTVSRDGLTLTVLEAQDLDFAFDTPGNYEFKITLDRESGSANEQSQSLYCFVSIPAGDSNIYAAEDSIAAFALPDGIETKLEPVELWQYLLIALLVILTAEWWVYYRV
jgi:hypothetical protein